MSIAKNDRASNGGPTYLAWNLDSHGLEKHEADVLQVLGAALLDHWHDLPRDIQSQLFQSAAAKPQETSVLKHRLAQFLHDNA